MTRRLKSLTASGKNGYKQFNKNLSNSLALAARFNQ